MPENASRHVSLAEYPLGSASTDSSNRAGTGLAMFNIVVINKQTDAIAAQAIKATIRAAGMTEDHKQAAWMPWTRSPSDPLEGDETASSASGMASACTKRPGLVRWVARGFARGARTQAGCSQHLHRKHVRDMLPDLAARGS